jgi:uncharacterized coiled-coil DUF342 family protein
MPNRYDDDKARFLESNDRFQQAMLTAIKAHQQGVAEYLDTLVRVGEHEDQLTESIDELKRLIIEQGQQYREQRTEIQSLRGEVRELRTRFDGHT